MNTRPVSAHVLDAAIQWQLNMDGSSGNDAELARWLAAD